MTLVDKLLTGTYTALLGIGVVFLMLLFLVFILVAMDKLGAVNYKQLFLKLRKKQGAISDSEKPKALDTPKTADGTNNAKLVAAITAAIAAYTAESGESPKAEFIVKSIRKI